MVLFLTDKVANVFDGLLEANSDNCSDEFCQVSQQTRKSGCPECSRPPGKESYCDQEMLECCNESDVCHTTH